jgi:hypothetical protein
MRRGGRLGTAGPLIDPSVAIKPWHMACVEDRDFVANGMAARGRGHGKCKQKFTLSRCNYFWSGAFGYALVNGNRKVGLCRLR